jgi:phosphinothricin acetyltransferase
VADRGGFSIEPMTPEDGDAVLGIYAEGIATGVATFEAAAPDWRRWNATHRKECRFVARDGAGTILGWTALSSWSGREVYAGVVWESVYVASAARGRGVGRALLTTLLPAAEAAGIWTVMAGVQAENAASLALHESAGFRRIGVQKRIARDRDGVWRDVVLLEWRSPSIGA